MLPTPGRGERYKKNFTPSFRKVGKYGKGREQTLSTSLNIIVNWEKSNLTPRQAITFLGMEIHSRTLVAFPSQRRIDNLLNLIEDFLSQEVPPAQDWLTLLGHLSSLIHLVPGG
ncbi:hypothetical protein E2C01_032303 [Portunus trituberculatus]|uniref:Uncharacterized protein n=1 Tax=Portunus trituberculatus TaxID=210409 RepID=A0A5B7EZY5_PORTR|nr:hypothetical protein [Portunus trituberculatus]